MQILDVQLVHTHTQNCTHVHKHSQLNYSLWCLKLNYSLSLSVSSYVKLFLVPALFDPERNLQVKELYERSASTENLQEETYGHINSAFCDGIATTVTIAHHFVWRHLYASMQAAQTPARKLRFVTPDKESSMNTLWQKEEFEQICSRESLTEKAADIEKTISVKEHERERYDFDPTIFYENLFWNWRPDSMVIKVGLGIFHIMSPKEFPQGSAV